MKFRRLSSVIALAAVTLFLFPANVAAQDAAAQPKTSQHHHYKFIDLGTFGGPTSYYANGFDGILNRHGTSAGWADTSTADPFTVTNPAFCFNFDCFVSHAFQSRDGIVTDLGSLAPGWSSQATWINNAGQVVGFSENGNIDPLTGFPEFRAVLWDKGSSTQLGTLPGGHHSVPSAINNRGQIAGFASNTIPDPYSFFPFPGAAQDRAILWQNGSMQDLGTLGGPDANAIAINDRGQIAGASYTSNTPNATTGVPTLDPFIWENGAMFDLGTLGGTSGTPTAMNNRGEVVGQSNLAGDLSFHPFLWTSKDGMKDLGTLGGNNGVTNWINDAGDIAGKTDLPGPLPQNHDAVLWQNTGATMTDLGTLPGDSCSNAYYVNQRGQVVGTSEGRPACLIPYGEHAFLSEDGGPMVDLNTLIPPGSSLELTFAVAINDHGEIVGWGVPQGCSAQNYEFCGHAYVLIPCDDDHPDVDGCDYSMVDGDTAAAAGTPSPATKVPSPFIQGNPALRGPMNPMLRRFGPRFGPWYRAMGAERLRTGSASDSEAVPSASSSLQVDDLISARDRAEISDSLGLSSDAAENSLSCPVPICSPNHPPGHMCGGIGCYRGIVRFIYEVYDPKYKRHCRYYGQCLGASGTTQ